MKLIIIQHTRYKMEATNKGFNTTPLFIVNELYNTNEDPDSKAYYMIREDFKNNSPFEVLFCSDLNLITTEYNQKLLKNQHTPYKIELLYYNENGEKKTINNFEVIIY